MSDSASPATARFLDAAQARGPEVDVHTWPQGTRTAQDAARAVGCDVLRVLMDPTLLDHEVIWAAAGTPDTTFPTAPSELQEAADATVAEFTES